MKVVLDLAKLARKGYVTIYCTEKMTDGGRCGDFMNEERFGMWRCNRGHGTYLPQAVIKVRSGL